MHNELSILALIKSFRLELISTSSMIVTKSWLNLAFSAPSCKPVLARLLDTWSAFSSAPSKEPYFFISFTAVFSPTPETPGTLSELSPINPRRSIIFSGGTPHLSSTLLLS